MSKSFTKYKSFGICYGNNTSWYRLRRKHWRRVNRNRLRDVMTKYDGEEIDENYKPFEIPDQDQWREPTDGHWKVYTRDILKRINKNIKGGWFGIYLTKDKKYIRK